MWFEAVRDISAHCTLGDLQTYINKKTEGGDSTHDNVPRQNKETIHHEQFSAKWK